MANHIIKYEYCDGVKLDVPTTWCGAKGHGFLFTGAGHAVMSIESGMTTTPCKKCLKAIRRVIDRELG